MKCFFHENEEARGVCKKCGKGICIDCSATSQHTGYCPSCVLQTYRTRLAWSILAVILIPSILLLLILCDVIKLLFAAVGPHWGVFIVLVWLVPIIGFSLVIRDCEKVIRLVKAAMNEGIPIDKQ